MQSHRAELLSQGALHRRGEAPVECSSLRCGKGQRVQGPRPHLGPPFPALPSGLRMLLLSVRGIVCQVLCAHYRWLVSSHTCGNSELMITFLLATMSSYSFKIEYCRCFWRKCLGHSEWGCVCHQWAVALPLPLWTKHLLLGIAWEKKNLECFSLVEIFFFFVDINSQY